MPDRPNRDADQLDAYLNGDSVEGDYDDLTAFARRVVRQGSLRDSGSPPPSPEQVDRIRDLVFARTTEAGRGKAAMTTHIFNADGPELAPPIVRIEPARSTPASPLSILTMAALIALIAVAGFGAYRGSLDFLPGGGAPDTRQAPGIAPSPQVTPSDIKGCTLDEQISVFEDTVPNVVGLDTAVRVDDDGTMTLVCDGQETEIA
ncbi:MAG TPA: hypothetical protein VHG52_08685, partial [Thermomicrobiales bacterium]|nr:hypothetical protein [Thermomicrobiales bacterium]